MAAERGSLRIEVCRASPDGALRIALELDAGATVEDALTRCREALSSSSSSPSPAAQAPAVAIFGRRATLATALHDGDRIELLRPLTVDPMEARRRRAVKRATAAGA